MSRVLVKLEAILDHYTNKENIFDIFLDLILLN